MFWSLVRPDRILPPITRSAAVATSLEAGELAVVMITCGGRNRGRMTHDGQRCERILRRLLPPCHCGLCCFMADPKRKPRQSDVDRDTRALMVRAGLRLDMQNSPHPTTVYGPHGERCWYSGRKLAFPKEMPAQAEVIQAPSSEAP